MMTRLFLIAVATLTASSHDADGIEPQPVADRAAKTLLVCWTPSSNGSPVQVDVVERAKIDQPVNDFLLRDLMQDEPI